MSFNKAGVTTSLQSAIAMLNVDLDLAAALVARAYIDLTGTPIDKDPVVGGVDGGVGGGMDFRMDDMQIVNDGQDARALNCRRHDIKDGQVTALHITIHKPQQRRRFACVHCSMLDQNESGGNAIVHVVVRDKQGHETFADVRQGTGYNGGPQDQIPRFDALLQPGNPDGNFFMGRGASFTPPNLGPLGYVILQDGEIVSDAVCSWGLSMGQHIGGRIIFQEI